MSNGAGKFSPFPKMHLYFHSRCNGNDMGKICRNPGRSGEPLARSWGRPCLSHTPDSACSTWLDSRTALLNSSPSAVSHSSSNVGVSGEQYPRLRARSITQLARWRSDRRLGETAPCAGGLCTSDEQATVARCMDCIVQSVAAKHSRRVICVRSTSRVAEPKLLHIFNSFWLNVLSDGEVGHRPRPTSKSCDHIE